MIFDDILDQVRNISNFYEEKQKDNVTAAAEIIAKSVAAGGLLYLYKIGHFNEKDLVNRAGGPAFIRNFSFDINIDSTEPECRKSGEADQTLARARACVELSSLKAGDVLMLGSVSGRNSMPVEVALAAAEKGVSVIGFTSMVYTKEVKSLHPSGKRLCDVCHLVVDLGTPYGDACVETPWYDYNIIPISGISALIGSWLIVGTAVELLNKQGLQPTMFKSINGRDGQEFYDACIKRFNEKGY